MSHFMFTMLAAATSMLVLVAVLVKVSEYRGRAAVDPRSPASETQPVSPNQRHWDFLVLLAPAAFIAYTWAPGALGVPFKTDERG